MNHKKQRQGGILILLRDIEIGAALSADPVNANRPPLEPRITTLNSPWFGAYCSVCAFKFREGDRVRQCSLCGEPYHDDGRYRLHCWQKHFADGGICRLGGDDRFGDGTEPLAPCRFPEQLDPKARDAFRRSLHIEQADEQPYGAGLAEQFIAGVETVWRPFGDQPSFQVRPGTRYVGLSCPWCRFKVRVGDWVVPCPCGSGCGTVFHQDVFRHLTCWNEWNGIGGKPYCPSTGAPYASGSRHDHR